MKKLFLIAALAAGMLANAQVVNLDNVRKVNLPENTNQKVAGIAPDGSYVLLTSQSNVGLVKYELATGTTTVLTTAEGSGYNAKVARDGQSVTYREVTLKKNLRQVSLKSINLGTRKVQSLQAPSRNLQPTNLSMEVSIQNQQLMLTVAGSTKMLSPNGTNRSYIWPSISPDKRHILYYVCGMGAYVCDITGKNVQYLGHDLRAPKWLDNNTIVAMDDKDNGETLVSSTIVVANLQGQQQVLTDASLMLMYPYASENGKTIVCSAANGDVYLVTLK